MVRQGRAQVSESIRVGVDIGGTFTDVVIWNSATESLHHLKVPTDAAGPHRAVVRGVVSLCQEAGVNPEDLRHFAHGTTLAVNALVERRGAPTGLLVTLGFRDLLTLGRLRLPVVNHLYANRPEPLVPRKWVREVPERILPDGRQVQPLDRQALLNAARQLLESGVQTLAVCFLHAYRYPQHEREAVDLLRSEFPGCFVCGSHEVWPQQREYERALATALNAYIGERMVDYLSRLRGELAEQRIHVPVYITRSNGGIMRADEAIRRPVDTLISGPASGVTGALEVAKQAGLDRIITFDMGGTTADVAVLDRELPYEYDHELAGLPLTLPAIAITSVGAGGGSVVWVDGGGLLKVGPHSAGAQPGPVCYGQGGEEPTVTDAYVVTGILEPGAFLGGRQRLDGDAAVKAFERLGSRFGMTAQECARQVLHVTTANMYAEFVPLMARRGINFRDFALCAYGGAGPTHVFLLADAVGMDRIFIPGRPGTLCALGALMADLRADWVYSLPNAAAAEELSRALDGLEREAARWLAEQGVDPKRRRLIRRADVRYRGQAYDLQVDLPPGPLDLWDLAERFHQVYQQVYGFADPSGAVEIMNLRVQAVGEGEKPGGTQEPATGGRPCSPRALGQRSVWCLDTEWKAGVYRRDDLLPGAILQGPAIIQQFDTTVFVTPGWTVAADARGNLLGRRQEAGGSA